MKVLCCVGPCARRALRQTDILLPLNTLNFVRRGVPRGTRVTPAASGSALAMVCTVDHTLLSFVVSRRSSASKCDQVELLLHRHRQPQLRPVRRRDAGDKAARQRRGQLRRRGPWRTRATARPQSRCWLCRTLWPSRLCCGLCVPAWGLGGHSRLRRVAATIEHMRRRRHGRRRAARRPGHREPSVALRRRESRRRCGGRGAMTGHRRRRRPLRRRDDCRGLHATRGSMVVQRWRAQGRCSTRRSTALQRLWQWRLSWRRSGRGRRGGGA